MSVSEFPIPSKDEVRQDPRREARDEDLWEEGLWGEDRWNEDRWSPRFTLVMVVLSSLILWCGIVLLISWIF